MLFKIRRCICHPRLPTGSSQSPPQRCPFAPILQSGGKAPKHLGRGEKTCRVRWLPQRARDAGSVALVPSLLSPVLSPPPGFFAKASSEGHRKPAPAHCACLSHYLQGWKGCPGKARHCPRAGQRDVDKKEPQLGQSSRILGFLAVAPQGPCLSHIPDLPPRKDSPGGGGLPPG